MEILKLLILLCYVYIGLASHDTHTIPVENYETELHNLGEHVEIPETPVRIIKITKTVAVKVPVPYPVKVIEKVPYPVHISKPYPVPVPHIVKVPHVESPPKLQEHEALGSNDELHNYGQRNYQVQEVHSDLPSNSYNQNFEPYNEGSPSEGSSGDSYDVPPHSYYGNTGGHDAESFESKNYDIVLKDYLQKHHAIGNAMHDLPNRNYH